MQMIFIVKKMAGKTVPIYVKHLHVIRICKSFIALLFQNKKRMHCNSYSANGTDCVTATVILLL